MKRAAKLVVERPFDGGAIAELELVGWRQADAMLDRAVSAHGDRSRRLPRYRRIEILRRLAAMLRDRREALASLIAREGGKPLKDARIEADRAANGVDIAREEISLLHGSEIPMNLTEAGSGRIAYTRKEPIGPVVAVSAFNHPLNLIVHQVVPAIATGCGRECSGSPKIHSRDSFVMLLPFRSSMSRPREYAISSVASPDVATSKSAISAAAVAALTLNAASEPGVES